ncbi:MAG: dipeptidase [Thermoleophilaceae bacterium]|nr:dipeptidase [Thermoleophilaceae bacterium]
MTAPAPRIVAIGGGGFASTPDSPLIDYVLGAAEKPRPRVCFVPTAGGDALPYVALFYRACLARDCEPSDLPLFDRTGEDVREKLLAQDVIWVGGGNTANMLAIWRIHGVDLAMREAWESGIVLSGSSAGMICWFEASITDSFGPQMAPLDDGLGFLPGSACPHYDSQAARRPVYHEALANGFPAGYAADEQVALRFDGTELAECVTGLEGHFAWRVERNGEGVVVERPLPTRLLRAAGALPPD